MSPERELAVGIALSGLSARPSPRWGGRIMRRMNLPLGFARHTGIRLAEVGFLLLLFAGVWLVAAQIPQFKFKTGRTIVAGLALAISGLLLIFATHWGHFG
jgi:hypothetical protein